MRGTAPGGTPSMRAGRMPAAFSTASPSSICGREQQPPARVGELGGQRHARERVQRIVEVEQQLAPQHAGHVLAARRPRSRSRRASRASRPRRRRSASCRWWRDGSAAAAPSPCVCTTLNGTMPGTTRAMPPSRASSTSTLPTPFCRLTTVAPDGACSAISSAIAAVAPLLTVTRMISASANAAAGSVASRTADGGSVPVQALEVGDAQALSARSSRPGRCAAAASRRVPPAPGSRRRSSRCCRRRPRRCEPALRCHPSTALPGCDWRSVARPESR